MWSIWKRSSKRTTRTKNDNSGCMWGFVSMFYFRPGGRAPKLLSDRSHGSGRRGSGNWYSRSKMKLLKNIEEKRDDLNDVNRRNAKEVGLTAKVENSAMEDVSTLQDSTKISISGSDPYKKSFASGCNLIGKDVELPTSLENQSDLLKVNEKLSQNLDLFAMLNDCCNDRHKNLEMQVGSRKRIHSYPSEENKITVPDHSLDPLDVRVLTDDPVLQKILGEVFEAFLYSKYYEYDARPAASDGEESEDFMKASETLHFNKELFLKALRDPNSLLVKQIQILQSADYQKPHTAESCRLLEDNELLWSGYQESVTHELFKKNVHRIFCEKSKSLHALPSEENGTSQPPSRIVILKPNSLKSQSSSIATEKSVLHRPSFGSVANERAERANSNFSVREIRKRLKHLVSMDGILHKIPYGSKTYGDISKRMEKDAKVADLKRPHFNENSSQPFSSTKMIEKITKTELSSSGFEFKVASSNHENGQSPVTKKVSTQNEEFNFQREAKKHLIEKLDCADGFEISEKQSSKSLEQLLSLHECDTHTMKFISEKNKEFLSPFQPCRSPAQQINSGELFLSMPDNIPSANNKSNVELSFPGLNPELLNMQIQEISLTEEVSNPRESVEIAECDIAKSTNERSRIDVISDCHNKRSANEAVKCEHEGSNHLAVESSNEKGQPTTSFTLNMSSNSLIHAIESPESTEKAERPSPVSVLEPLFSYNIITPVITAMDHATEKFLMPPRKLHFEEHEKFDVCTPLDGTNIQTCMSDEKFKSEYVRALLEASGLCHCDISERRQGLNQLLDLSFYDEVETPSEEIPDDLKLLFDFINEVIEEIYGRSSNFIPWVSFIGHKLRPFPSGENLIQRVCKGVNSDFIPQLRTSLDKIIKRDMDIEPWLDIRSVVEYIGIAVEHELLEELLEEAAIELFH